MVRFVSFLRLLSELRSLLARSLSWGCPGLISRLSPVGGRWRLSPSGEVFAPERWGRDERDLLRSGDLRGDLGFWGLLRLGGRLDLVPVPSS